MTKLTPADLLKLLADSTRLRSLMLLLQEGELCVCELTYALDEIQPKISRHLASLRDTNVVSVRRAGQWIYYRVNPQLPGWAVAILQAALAGMHSDSQYQASVKKLNHMPDRPENRICA
jgi:ArsR family transcriptional regulator